ncbi:hypothetical protein BUE80_DR005083 [Diplocarpon rosae]|nr:hypothetical protein BUE80_DR005083 [Diplocarpon rosae]
MSTPCSLICAAPYNATKLSAIKWSCRPLRSVLHANHISRSLATVQQGPKVLPGVWFTGTVPQRNLQSPLPQDILSPHISLHLFPSTHPHLPTVSGRVAYSAALWTSPIAWGRVPLVGDVRLTILSERMVKPTLNARSSSLTRQEQLIVRWRTVGKTKGKGIGAFYKGIGARERVDKITEWLGGGKGEDDSKEFTGLFIFEFDEEGRILSHTIEHVQEGGNWEQGVGARVVGLTDWLLGGMRKGREDEGAPCPACCENERRHLEL